MHTSQGVLGNAALFKQMNIYMHIRVCLSQTLHHLSAKQGIYLCLSKGFLLSALLVPSKGTKLFH